MNRYGYKVAFIGSLLSHTIASFCFLFIQPEISHFYVLVICGIARSFRGVGDALIKTTASAYVKQDKGGRSKLIQLLIGGKDTTKGIGILTGGFLLTSIGIFSSFIALGLVTAICTFIALIFIKDHRENKIIDDFKGFLRVRKQMKYLSLARAFLYSGRDLWLVIPIPVFAVKANIEPSITGSILAAGVIGFGIAQPFFNAVLRKKNRLKNKWKRRPLLIWAPFVLAVLTTSLLWIPSSIENFIWVIFAYNIFAALATVPHNHFELKFARRKRASADIAYYKTISHIGKVFAVLASGYLYDKFGLNGCLLAACFVLLIASFIGFILRKPCKKA